MPRPTLEELRKPARVAAEECLRESGFELSGEQWVGSIQVGSTSAPVRLALPAEFPDRLPRIVIEPDKMPGRVFNCDQKGVLCLAPPSGILLDATNPAGLIAESLDRARAILHSAGQPQNPAAIAQEFRSYWTAPESIISICSRLADTREVPVIRFGRRPVDVGREQEKTEILVCDAHEDGERWLQRQRCQTVSSDMAFLCALDDAILPPPFGEQLSVAELKNLVRQASRADQYAHFMRWVDRHGLPCSLLLSIPTLGGDRVLIGAGFQEVKAATKKLAFQGDRYATARLRRRRQDSPSGSRPI